MANRKKSLALLGLKKVLKSSVGLEAIFLLVVSMISLLL